MAHSFATSTVLSLNSGGPAVMELRNHLNGIGPTRLPLLTAGATFDLPTKIRVMEFQWQHRLKADGVVGKMTAGHLSKTPSTDPIPTHPSGRCIVVDLVNRVLRAYRDGVEKPDHIACPRRAEHPRRRVPDVLATAAKSHKQHLPDPTREHEFLPIL